MNFLNKNEVKEDSVVPIYFKDKLEGYARLLKQEGDSISFIPQSKDEKSTPIFIKERWLIEWVNVFEVRGTLTYEQKWTQKTIAGRRTHRHITYKAYNNLKEYISKNGRPWEDNPNDRGENYILDDDNSIF